MISQFATLQAQTLSKGRQLILCGLPLYSPFYFKIKQNYGSCWIFYLTRFAYSLTNGAVKVLSFNSMFVTFYEKNIWNPVLFCFLHLFVRITYWSLKMSLPEICKLPYILAFWKIWIAFYAMKIDKFCSDTILAGCQHWI